MKQKDPELKVIVNGEIDLDILAPEEQRGFYSALLSRIQEDYAKKQLEAEYAAQEEEK